MHFLAGLGCGFTAGLVTLALVGERWCVSLSFSAGVFSATLLLIVAGMVIGYVLRPLPLTPPEDHRSVEL